VKPSAYWSAGGGSSSCSGSEHDAIGINPRRNRVVAASSAPSLSQCNWSYLLYDKPIFQPMPTMQQQRKNMKYQNTNE